MGHSFDDRTRYSAALLSSNDGQVGLPYGNAYTGFFTASQAFDAGKAGVQRIGFYAMAGEAPTTWLTQGGILFTAPMAPALPQSATRLSAARASWGSSTSARMSILRL